MRYVEFIQARAGLVERVGALWGSGLCFANQLCECADVGVGVRKVEGQSAVESIAHEPIEKHFGENALFVQNELGLQDEIIPTQDDAKARFIVRNHKLYPVFSNPFNFTTSSLLSLRAKIRLATEPFRTKRGNPDDTAKQFFERRFGKEAARILAGAFISGVYAGDPNLLSAKAAFPLFIALF